MPVLIAWLVQALAGAAGYLAWRVIAALGIGFVTYTGVDLLLSGAETKIFELLGAVGPQAAAMYGVLQIGTCIKIVFAALGMRAAAAGMVSGGIRKMGQS